MSDAEGLQASHEELLQQQTAEFRRVVEAAQAQMEEQVRQFQETVKSAKENLTVTPTPKMEIKYVDGGLWLNDIGTKALIALVEGMSALLQELDKQ